MSSTTPKAIDKAKFESILSKYQTQSLFYYFFFWLGLSDKRSATIVALMNLTKDTNSNEPITKQKIHDAIGTETNINIRVHRYSLFNNAYRVQKNGSSTDEVLYALQEEFQKVAP